MNFLQPIGRFFLAFLATTGRLGVFAGASLSHGVRPPFYPRIVVRQMVEIGYFSLPVVGLTALYSGMVLALQSYTGFARFSAEGAIANVVVLSSTREVGATALSITHDMASARKIANRIAMLFDGKIIWPGPTGEIDESDNAHVDQFIHGRAEGPIKMAVRA